MSKREDLVAVLDGAMPQHTPYGIYDWLIVGEGGAEALVSALQAPEWRRLLDEGLCILGHCELIEAVEHDVETVQDERTDGSDTYLTVTKRTPVGEIRKVTHNGWHSEDWVKAPGDYKVIQWIVEHTELVPRYERLDAYEAAIGEDGITYVTGSGEWLHRSPLMKINVDWAGTQQFCMDVAMEVPELFDLYDALRRQFIEEQKLIASGPGRYVVWPENLTISMIGPKRYADYLMPIYRECVPLHEAVDKRVFVHYDGALNVIADQIAAAPFHGIDSLTEPPEGDMMYDACRAAWPDKVFCANINVDLYKEPPEVLKRDVRAKIDRAGKQASLLQISEDLPENWETSIPMVLEALREG